MSIPPERIGVGKCYLTNTGRVSRIVGLLSDGRILYEHRLVTSPHEDVEARGTGRPSGGDGARTKGALRLVA